MNQIKLQKVLELTKQLQERDEQISGIMEQFHSIFEEWKKELNSIEDEVMIGKIQLNEIPALLRMKQIGVYKAALHSVKRNSAEYNEILKIIELDADAAPIEMKPLLHSLL